MENKNTMYKVLSVVLVVVLFFIMLKMYNKEKDLRIEQENLIEASAAELETWKNKDGENMAKIQVMETMNIKTFQAFKTQDSTIKSLQKLVTENYRLFKKGGVGGILNSETHIHNAGPTTITYNPLDSSLVYKNRTKNQWYDIYTEARKDSTVTEIKTFHELSIVVGTENQGFLKKRKPFAIAKDKNIYSNIKDMKFYNVSEKKKHFVVGPFAGGGATLVGQQVYAGWQVGFGIVYKWIEF